MDAGRHSDSCDSSRLSGLNREKATSTGARLELWRVFLLAGRTNSSLARGRPGDASSPYRERNTRCTGCFPFQCWQSPQPASCCPSPRPARPGTGTTVGVATAVTTTAAITPATAVTTTRATVAVTATTTAQRTAPGTVATTARRTAPATAA